MKTLKRFCAYYRPYLGLFCLDMLCALGVALCNLFYPKLTGVIIDDFIPGGNVRAILIFSAVLIVLYIGKRYMNYFIQDYGHRMATDMQADMRRDLFAHIERLPFSYFDNNKTGALISRIVSDLLDVSELAHHGPEDLFLAAVLLVGSFALMASVNLWLTLIIFAFIPIMVVFAMHMRKKMSVEFRAMRAENAVINASIENSLSGVRVTKAYVAEDYENQKFDGVTKSYVRVRARALRAMAQFHSDSTFLFDLLKLLTLVSGGLFCIYGKITPGDFAAFLIYVNVFTDPINRIVNFVEQFQNGMSGFERFCSIMDLPVEADAPDAEPLGEVRGYIEFRDVSFRYGESKEILHDLSFRIEAGHTLALVGPSGGGKSTICNIIPRFYDIEGGSVTIDGRDIRSLTLDSLRRGVGIVSQDVFLFDSTIRDNITYGSPHVSEEYLQKVLDLACLRDVIDSLPEGLNTLVGEQGNRLSGGQRQRISIARALIRNPQVIIFDEATSALDTVSEKHIQTAIDNLSKDKTTFIVAHRLSTIKNADKIAVIKDGHCVEFGTYNELLEKKGEFYRFRQMQV